MNHSVSLYASFTIKRSGHDRNVKMALAVLCTLVTCVQLTLIFEEKFGGLKSNFQVLPDLLFTIGRQGSTLLKGLTTTRS